MQKLKRKIKALKNNTKFKVRLLVGTSSLLLLIIGITTYFTTYSDLILEFSEDPDYIESSIKNNKVIVNDLENDYNYYQGQNYLDNDGTLPTTDNKNIYNDSTLVQAKITYYSDDDNNHKGYVSSSERQDTYIYFKTFYVNNNGTDDTTDDYVLIELIDNPFTDRPTDKAFNGWFTDYNGATLSFNKDYYERYAKVPVTYTDNKPNKIEITFRASWVGAKITTITSSNSWNSTIESLNTPEMHKLETIINIYEDVDMTGYYHQVSVRFFDSCTGYYNNRGQRQNNCTCYSFGGCTYYDLINGENFNENATYYELQNNNMQLVDNSTINRPLIETIEDTSYENGIMSSFYRKILVPRGSSIIGYYDSTGNIMTSGSCTTNGGCTYYELINYYKSDGTPEIYDENEEYYYLTTRDTNIIVMGSNIEGTWSTTEDIPFTVTALNNGTQNNVTWNANSAINCYSDVRIENITLYYDSVITEIYDPPSNTMASGVLYGRYNNVKLGRGLTQNGSYPTLRAVIGGSNSSIGSNNSPAKYKLVIESGIYNSISLTNGATRYGGSTIYVKNKGVYGNDYDRVIKDNDSLDVYYCASGSWSGTVYASTNSATSSDIALDLVVKNGSFGSSKYDLSTGIYVGGRYAGTHNAARRAKIEGGYIYNLIGGPLTSSRRRSVNDTYINMTGGEVDIIIGGAGTTATYGNRIISVTGGTVNYSVFGGSNGAKGNEGDGTLNGTPYIYIGGTATIGNDTNISNNNKLFGAESGSVFGIGNGKENSSTIGSADNSIIIIDGNSNIKRNIYGGGNYGATGVSSSLSSTYSTIIINDGFIDGDVYGGGNNNGSGSESKTSTVSITMNGGNVVGSIYGGSNELGTIYGSTNVNIFGGEVSNNVYGGGRGGYISDSAIGTFVVSDVNIVIGDSNSTYTPIIDGSVYGGSAFGSVNGSENTNTVSSSKTNVTINKGIINNVFGGGQGNNTYTPYVLGNIEVTVNNGTITNVYGGNDLKGKPNGNITVTINNGIIENTYGGGNETSANETNVYLNGGTSTKLFGGSNKNGDVVISNVTATGGTCETLYGGNNAGGTTGTTNVLINGGTINTVYGGGDKTSVTTSTNVVVNNKVDTIFGGSNLSGNIPLSNIEVNNAIINAVYGGNNQGGKVETTNVNINGNFIDSVYGGGLKAETTTTNLNLNYGLIKNVYGGGNEAGANETNVNLGGADIINLFGGSNKSGDVQNTYIKNIEDFVVSDLSAEFTISQSNINQIGATDISGSETITVEINNNTGVTLSEWDLYILTSESIFDSNWSSSEVEFDSINNIYHIDETNQWYGTNSLNNGTPFTFEFNIHSYDTYENFKIYSYMLIGYDTNGNQYTSKLTVDKMYGGNNLGGITNNAQIDLTAGSINVLFGGGNKASVTNSSTNIDNVVINEEIYGGGNEADVSSVILNINNSEVGNITKKGVVYGGGNAAKVTNSLELNINSSEINGNIYGGGNKGKVETKAKTTITTSHITDNIYGGGNEAEVQTTEVNIKQNTNIDNNIYGGGNLGTVLGEANTVIENSNITNSVFGGGNAAEVQGDANVTIHNSIIDEAIYGGGNGEYSIVPGDEIGDQNPAKVLGNTNLLVDENTKVKTIYGGGNLGKVNKDTKIEIKNITVTDSIYGGGNAAIVGENTNLYVSNVNVTNSIYAGGNGLLAVVYGNTNLDIDNNTVVGKHVFGGGNAAATGTEENNNSKGIVNIVGATINGNVYGGANTSQLYGDTTVNIGNLTSSNQNLIKSDIVIEGTVFGGGEANASGSEEYDYSFISVTVGIKININGSGHDTFTIKGSIFGSGNASSTTGYSYIDIKNYGTKEDIKRNISIQRANIVTLDNSYIELKGATDRTNEYSTVLFSLSRIDELKLINNTSLYLQNGGNLVKKLSSLAIENNIETKAQVTIDTETNTFTRNTNNRIYMLEGKNLNIATNENITSFGEVSGMTFFGMYLNSINGDIVTALYNDYDPSASVSSGDIYYFTKGSYVLGMHKTNHDITEDGFYTNYGNEEGNGIIINYIEPTPDNSDFYMWSVGEKVDSYELTLTASKYSTLGTYELSLLNHATANTKFSILGFNYSALDQNIVLTDYRNIPRIAATEEDANTIFGLNMKSGQNGWITKGSTNFITGENTNVQGTIDYQRENLEGAPSLVFYFYHSKNLTETQNLGSVTISLVAITPIDDLNNEVKRININVNLNTALYNTNDYEGTITPGKKYEMFATSPVDITTKSSFSAYYSLYMESETTPYKTGYHRSLVSTYLLPVNTELTMIDFHVEDKPVYYYYTVTEDDYTSLEEEYNLYGEVSYPLSKFIKMGSTSPNNNYDDATANTIYYKDEKAIEEFIFMVDFKDTNIETDILDKSLLIELRNNDNQTLISVLGIEQSTMKYNLYNNREGIIELSGNLSQNTIYRGKSTNLTLDTNFIQDKISTNTIFDTNFDEQKLGIKITILDSRGTPLTSSSLMGINYTFNGNTYYPRYDGTVRINITEKVANARSKIIINTENSNLSSGEYTLLIESFGSADGIYYGLNSSDQLEITFNIVDNIYGLKVTTDDKMLFINKDTGFTLNGNNSYVYKVEYTSGLSNPNTRLKLLRRDYTSIYTNVYNEVDLKDYVTNTLEITSNDKEYYLSKTPVNETTYFLYFKENLPNGTYKLVVSLYDDNNYIGETYQYIIIK